MFLSELFLQYTQLFIMESPFEAYFTISCYYVHEGKLLYVYENWYKKIEKKTPENSQ